MLSHRGFVVLATLWNSLHAQSIQPCSPKDAGPFLAVNPILTMDVFENDAGQYPDRNRYRSEVRVNGVVGGTGADGIVLEVEDYAFLNPGDYFSFVHNNSINYADLKGVVDRDGPTPFLYDDINFFSFTLRCAPYTNTSNATYFDAKIFVKDINDNSPKFDNMSSELSVNELTPVGTRVLQVRATDLDLSSNLTYMLLTRSEKDVDDDMSSHFAIDAVTGEVTIAHPLDYETMSSGSVVIVVTDGGSEARTSSMLFTVHVQDGDDQGPEFVYTGCFSYLNHCAWPKYTASTVLKQGEAISVWPVPNKVSAYVPIKARDMDFSKNPVTFSIISTIPPGREDSFTVAVSQNPTQEYVATITPKETTTVSHGFEIFLKAEEQSANRRYAVAMILFEDSNQQQATSAPLSEAQNKYTEPVIAVIIVVAIVAALLACLAVAFLYVVCRSSKSRGSDLSLTRM